MTNAESDANDFAEIAETLQYATTPTATADEIVDYARTQVDADCAGISVTRAKGRLETIAPTDPLVAQCDHLQYALGQGPCRDESWTNTLTVTDLAEDSRWPLWAAKVTALGVASLLTVELTNQDDRRLGSINLYWQQRRMFGNEDIGFATIFARRAALALATAWNEAGFNVALDSRKLIGQAQGILMERYNIDGNQAFEVLRRFSQTHNIKLRHVAVELVTSRRLPEKDITTDQTGTRPPG